MIKTWLKHNIIEYALDSFFKNVGRNLFNTVISDHKPVSIKELRERWEPMIEHSICSSVPEHAKDLLAMSLQGQTEFNRNVYGGEADDLQQYTLAFIARTFNTQASYWTIGTYKPTFRFAIDYKYLIFLYVICPTIAIFMNMNEFEDFYQCSTCNGTGIVTVSYYKSYIIPSCCGNWNSDGSCCGHAIPEESEEEVYEDIPCPECNIE